MRNTVSITRRTHERYHEFCYLMLERFQETEDPEAGYVISTSALAYPPDELILGGMVRDFLTTHADFATTPAEGLGHYAGNVRKYLSLDGTPILQLRDGDLVSLGNVAVSIGKYTEIHVCLIDEIEGCFDRIRIGGGQVLHHFRRRVQTQARSQ